MTLEHIGVCVEVAREWMEVVNCGVVEVVEVEVTGGEKGMEMGRKVVAKGGGDHECNGGGG